MRRTSYHLHLFAALVVGVLVSQASHSGQVPVLTDFSEGTPAKAVDVNGHFNAITKEVNANDTRLGTLEATVKNMPAAATGPAGLPGAVGSQGLAGPQGVAGPVGPQGLAGPQGTAGAMGLQGAVGPAGSTPAGAVNFFATAACPAGWVMANGATVARASFPELFAAIGIEFGAGDGSTTFGLPELRGEFLRALDSGRGVDTGRALGSAQPNDWKTFSVNNTGGGSSAYSHDVGLIPKNGPNLTPLFGGAWIAPAGLMSFQWDSTSEIRPRNVALLACIKR